MIDVLAPIALFVYNRLEHLKQTIGALKKNYLATKSDLFVYSDGAKFTSHQDSVNEVRKFIRSIEGFKTIKIVESRRNIGLANSIVTGVSDVLKQYGSIIVLEDDLITSPYFLVFMNEALKKYHLNESVASIHGYVYPVKEKMPETFFLKDTGSWGWATWVRGWKLFEPNGQKLLKEIRARRLTNCFDFNGSYPFTKMLENQIKGKNDSWAIRWQASAFLNDKLTLYPGISLVENIGHDSSGAHCDSTDVFETHLAEQKINIEDIPIEENQHARKAYEMYFRSIKKSYYQRVKEKLKSFVR